MSTALIAMAILSEAAKLHYCPIAEPPIALGTGVLDQLIDVMLKRLFTSASSIVVDRKIALFADTNLTRIRIHHLDSIHRTCTTQISSEDKAGCNQRGILWNACIGFKQLKMDITMESWYYGMPHGEFSVVIPRISIDAVIELFSSKSPIPLNQAPSKAIANTIDSVNNYSFVRVVGLKFNEFDPIDVSTIQGDFTESITGWMAEKLFNLFKGKAIDRLDDAIIDAMNGQLRELRLPALFTNT